MKRNSALLLLIFLSSVFFIQAQEDPELEAYKDMISEYGRTGVEFFVYYPLSFHLPGWSYPSVHYDLTVTEFNLPGPNISIAGLGAGLEIDFGSRKRVLGNMGFGGDFEFSSLSDWNMRDDVDMDLLLTSLYLYYRTARKSGWNYSVSTGLGVGRAYGGSALFTAPEEKEDTAGPLFLLEGAAIFPPLKNFRFQVGLKYRYLAINTSNIHIISPLIRAGIRF